MSKIKIFITSFFAVCISTMLFADAVVPVNRVITDNNPPYSFLDASGVNVGESTEILQRIADILCQPLPLAEIFPEEQGIQEASKGPISLFYPLAESESIKARFKWVGPISQNDLYIAFSLDTPNVVIQAWQAALGRIKREKDIHGKTAYECICERYNDKTYIHALTTSPVAKFGKK